MDLFGVAIVVLLVGITLAVLVRSDAARRAPGPRSEQRERQSGRRFF